MLTTKLNFNRNGHIYTYAPWMINIKQENIEIYLAFSIYISSVMK